MTIRIHCLFTLMLQIYYKVYDIPVIVETKWRLKVPHVANFMASFQKYIVSLIRFASVL